jgi:hypothetical protein
LTKTNSGTLQLNIAVTVNGNLAITAGTLNANGNNIRVGGNWSDSGTFTPGGDTVTLVGSGQSISGNTTFTNLTKSVAAADILIFAAGSTQTVTGMLTLAGADATHLLALRSSTTGTQWKINPSNTTIAFLDVQDSNNINATTIVTTNSHDSGDNTNWLFAVAPAITSANNTTFTVGSAGTFMVTTTGVPAPSLSAAGNLPGGVTFKDNGNGTATLSGTPAPATGGTIGITITAHNGIGSDATQTFTLTVDQAPAITSGNKTAFATGTAGSFTLTATGFPAPTLSLSGALPGGVTFNAAGGVLSGTPAAGSAGTYTLTFKADNGVSPAATQSFSLIVTSSTVSSSTIQVGAFVDVNANGVQESGEVPLPGVNIFIDRNHNGVFAALFDPLAVTDAAGHATFANLPAGTYTVRLSAQQDIPVLLPDSTSSSLSIVVGAGATAVTTGFGLEPINPTTFLQTSANLQQPNFAGTLPVAFLEGLYHNILGRAGEATGLTFWLTELASGLDHSQIIAGFWNSLEHRNLEVDYYYQHFLGRQESSADQAVWAQLLQSGADESTIVSAFLNAPEYAQAHSDNTSFVNALYVQTLGRSADASGLNGWVASLNAGASRASVIAGILFSDESLLRGIDNDYAAALHRQGDPAGRQAWLLQARAGAALALIAQDFLGGGEYLQNAQA